MKRKFIFIPESKINENILNQNRKVFHIIVYFITILIILKLYKEKLIFTFKPVIKFKLTGQKDDSMSLSALYQA